MLLSACCCCAVLAAVDGARGQTPAAENLPGEDLSAQRATAQGTSADGSSGWSGADISNLRHAVEKGSDGDDRPAKLFSWAIGRPDVGDALDGGQDLDADEIETDRPDFTQNRKTVGLGVVQVESGLTYLHGRKNSFNDFSFPETLLRVGVVADWLELRISQNFASDRTSLINGRHTSKTGAQDAVFGVKLALTEQRGWLPEMGMILHTSAPTGSPGFSTPGMLLPGVNWLYGWDITKRWSLAGSSQLYKTTDLVPLPTSRGGISALDHVQHTFIVVAQSFSLEYEVTDKLTPYFEWFALFPSGAMDATKSP
ncbi:MAG TPA: transporter, partial [Pirellulales bacterium]